MQVDWSLGRYETTAAQLHEAARVVVDAAAVAPGEHVVDVGCGTGNATLLAAEYGARVTGVDPAERLLEVGRERASAQGLDVTFVQGQAGQLPLDDAGADVVVSVFGVIFASDARAALLEMARVLGSAGRLVISAWFPEGPIWEMNRVAGEIVARLAGAPPGPLDFPWHERDELAGVLEPLGFDVAVQEHHLAFTGSSPRDYIESQLSDHPFGVAGQAVIQSRGGTRDQLFGPMLAVLEAGNEDPAGFRVTSRYAVATARRS